VLELEYSLANGLLQSRAKHTLARPYKNPANCRAFA